MGEETAKAPFSLPEIQVNTSGWGPSNMETKFKDMPYQPFSKSDRLGKVRQIVQFTRSFEKNF